MSSAKRLRRPRPAVSSHVSTPLWPLQAPRCEVPLNVVPSLHLAIGVPLPESLAAAVDLALRFRAARLRAARRIGLARRLRARGLAGRCRCIFLVEPASARPDDLCTHPCAMRRCSTCRPCIAPWRRPVHRPRRRRLSRVIQSLKRLRKIIFSSKSPSGKHRERGAAIRAGAASRHAARKSIERKETKSITEQTASRTGRTPTCHAACARP